jgi:hypothetical protein
MADILTAMVMPDEDPVRHLGLVHTEYTLARLPNRLHASWREPYLAT